MTLMRPFDHGDGFGSVIGEAGSGVETGSGVGDELVPVVESLV